MMGAEMRAWGDLSRIIGEVISKGIEAEVLRRLLSGFCLTCSVQCKLERFPDKNPESLFSLKNWEDLHIH